MRLEFRTDLRGYELVLNQDLFGAFILYRRWFGLSQSSWRDKAAGF